MDTWPPPQFERFHETARRLRADSVRTRILSVHACLRLVEAQIKAHLINEARSSMEKLRHTTQEIDRHLREPGYVPSTALHELREMHNALQARMQETEKSIGLAA